MSLSLISSTKIGGASLTEICDDQSTRYQSKGLSRDLSPRTMTAYRRDALKGEPRHVGTKNPAIGLFTGKMTIMRQPGGGHLTIITNGKN